MKVRSNMAVPSREEFQALIGALEEFSSSYRAEVDGKCVRNFVLEKGDCQESQNAAAKFCRDCGENIAREKRELLHSHRAYNWLADQHPYQYSLYGGNVNKGWVYWFVTPERFANWLLSAAREVSAESLQGGHVSERQREMINDFVEAGRGSERDYWQRKARAMNDPEERSRRLDRLIDQEARVNKHQQPVDLIIAGLYRYFYMPPSETTGELTQVADELERAQGDVQAALERLERVSPALVHWRGVAARFARGGRLVDDIRQAAHPIGSIRQSKNLNERVFVVDLYSQSRGYGVLSQTSNLTRFLEIEGIANQVSQREVQRWIAAYKDAHQRRQFGPEKS